MLSEKQKSLEVSKITEGISFYRTNDRKKVPHHDRPQRKHFFLYIRTFLPARIRTLRVIAFSASTRLREQSQNSTIFPRNGPPPSGYISIPTPKSTWYRGEKGNPSSPETIRGSALLRQSCRSRVCQKAL